VVARFLARPGVQSSEFKVLVALCAWLGVNADQHWVSMINALIIAGAPAVTYAVSRGLAKNEQRPPGGA
jgi:hypothetical protein